MGYEAHARHVGFCSDSIHGSSSAHTARTDSPAILQEVHMGRNDGLSTPLIQGTTSLTSVAEKLRREPEVKWRPARNHVHPCTSLTPPLPRHSRVSILFSPSYPQSAASPTQLISHMRRWSLGLRWRRLASPERCWSPPGDRPISNQCLDCY